MINKENHSNFDSYSEEEEDDDTLSFRDLPILGDDDEEINNHSMMKKIPSLPSSSLEDPFEFFNKLLFEESTPATPRVIISKQKEQEPIVKLSASSSSSSSSSRRRNGNYYHSHNTSKSISNVEKVNITSITSMSSKSRRIMFMFGPLKFNPEMELSSIKMRQSKRAFPNNYVSEAAKELAIVSTADTTISGGGRIREWGLLRSLSRYRSRAATNSMPSTVMSCGCFS